MSGDRSQGIKRRDAVRFWHSHKGSLVRLRLEPGQSIELEDGGPTDEGWSYSSTILELEKARTVDPLNIASGWIVTLDYRSESRCCDGRMDSEHQSYCPIEELAAWNMAEQYPGQGYENHPLLPQWHHAESSQRDYAAEAAGY
jgi:hypothetical protein